MAPGQSRQFPWRKGFAAFGPNKLKAAQFFKRICMWKSFQVMKRIKGFGTRLQPVDKPD
jgi:hypothetical protein